MRPPRRSVRTFAVSNVTAEIGDSWASGVPAAASGSPTAGA
jgi:hypothetical protein